MFVNILSPKALSSKEDGEQFLRLLAVSGGNLSPEHYGNFEPVRNKFDPSRPEEAVARWSYPFLWTRTSPRLEGSVWMDAASRRRHGAVCISTAPSEVEAASAFVKSASVQLEADFAFLHLLTEPDVESGILSNTVFPLDKRRTKFNLCLTTFDLQKRLPELYWMTVFGRPYVRLFGRERILSAPAYSIHQLAPDIICLQLSESLSDLKTNYRDVDAVRREVKRHLGLDAFFNPAKPEEHKYRVPEFTFAP